MAKTATPMLAALMAAPRRPSDKQLVREHAKSTARRATQDWVEGRMTTKEHSAVHERAKHVLAGKQPREFKGPNGDRKMKGLM